VTILVPYTLEKLHPQTVELLNKHAPVGEELMWRRLDPSDQSAYARLLVEAWSWPGDLVLVEHDIGIHSSVFAGFDECRQPWCGHPYPIGSQLLVCLGCTRFTAQLKAMLPNLMEQAAAVEHDGGLMPAGDWRRMDVRIGALLEAHGHNRHPHLPAVEHFHTY
jgi:hypothetical protein